MTGLLRACPNEIFAIAIHRSFRLVISFWVLQLSTWGILSKGAERARGFPLRFEMLYVVPYSSVWFSTVESTLPLGAGLFPKLLQCPMCVRFHFLIAQSIDLGQLYPNLAPFFLGPCIEEDTRAKPISPDSHQIPPPWHFDVRRCCNRAYVRPGLNSTT